VGYKVLLGCKKRKFMVEVEKKPKNCDTLLDVSVSSLRRGHANLLCIVPILADDPQGVPLYNVLHSL
jgi:hypothetical protein